MKMTPDEIKDIMKLARGRPDGKREGTAASDGEAEEDTEPAPALRRDGYGRSGRPSLGYDPMRDGWDLNS